MLIDSPMRGWLVTIHLINDDASKGEEERERRKGGVFFPQKSTSFSCGQEDFSNEIFCHGNAKNVVKHRPSCLNPFPMKQCLSILVPPSPYCPSDSHVQVKKKIGENATKVVEISGFSGKKVK